MYGLSELIGFDTSASLYDSVHWSSDNRIAVVTRNSIRIMTPRIDLTSSRVARKRFTAFVEKTFIPAPDADKIQRRSIASSADSGDNRNLRSMQFRYATHASQLCFKAACWSPLGWAFNSGCLLVALTSLNDVLVFSHQSRPGTDSYRLVANLSALLPVGLAVDDVEIVSVHWGGEFVVLGCKSGRVWLVECVRGGSVFRLVDVDAGLHADGAWVQSISTVELSPGEIMFVSSASDGSVKLWTVDRVDGDVKVNVVCSLMDIDDHPVSIVKYVGSRVFIVKSTVVHVLDLVLDSDGNYRAVSLEEVIDCPPSSRITSINCHSETTCIVFMENGSIIAFEYGDNDKWNVDEHVTKVVHESLQNALGSAPSSTAHTNDEVETSDPNAPNQDALSDSWSPLEPCLIAKGSSIPSFSGSAFSNNFRYLAVCFSKLPAVQTSFRPPQVEDSSFIIFRLDQDLLMDTSNTVYDHDSMTPSFAFWDHMVSMKKKDGIPADDVSEFASYFRLATVHDGVVERCHLNALLESGSPDNPQLYGVAKNLASKSNEQDIEVEEVCPICSGAFTTDSLLDAKCPNNHKFSRCLDTFQVCRSGMNALKCLGCTRLRIAKYHKGVDYFRSKDTVIFKTEPRCNYCGDVMQLV